MQTSSNPNWPRLEAPPASKERPKRTSKKSPDVVSVKIRYGMVQIPREIFRQNAPKMRESLIDYLRVGFPFGEEWTYGNTIITANQMYRFLSIYRSVDPEGFCALWILWMSHERRQSTVESLGLSWERLESKWCRVADSIIAIALFPEFQMDLPKPKGKFRQST
jgi:hypothetical protein